MTLRPIDATLFRSLVPVGAAISALAEAFAATERASAPQRMVVGTGTADLLLMPAAGDDGVGIKLVTVNPANPERGLPLIHAIYVLFDAETTEPKALIDGEALTATRTSAVSAVATQHLAPEDASRLVIFGAGAQGRAHLEAMVAVRPIDHVTIVSRTRESASALTKHARELELNATYIHGETFTNALEDALAQADIVCTCTTSAVPLFDGSLLQAGVHVNAVGAYTPGTRELDDETIRRGFIVVETREAALSEAGDLLIPIRAGVVSEEHVAADLGEVVRGEIHRSADTDITVFKSVGVAFEDLAVARVALDALEEG